MPALFNIDSAQGVYSVEIRRGLLEDIFVEDENRAIVADEFFKDYLKDTATRFLTIPADETNKNLDTIPQIVVKLRQLGVNRQSCIMALGGGIIQDIVAFVASVYMRGISWKYIPTSLLSMADSCIGGKSSINVGEYKNIVGTFHVPKSILIDPTFVTTLSREQRIAGLIEAAKICYCRGPESFDRYLSYNPHPDMSIETFEQIIAESLLAKKWFIEIDEFDRKERLLLNLGHTFGHALEGAFHFQIGHGIAVGLGILSAIAIGPSIGRIKGDSATLERFEAHVECLLNKVPDLAPKLSALSIPDVLNRFSADKKHRSGAFVVIGFGSEGAVELIQLPKNSNSIDIIGNGFSQIIGRFCNEI